MQITSHAILKLPLLFSSTEMVVPELLETWLLFSPLGISQTKNISILGFVELAVCNFLL